MKRNNARLKYRTEFTSEFHYDYKDPVTLYRFIGEGGKITPSRINKLSNNHQRKVAAAVKVARNLSLLPSGGYAYDEFHRPDQISPVPFDY